MKKFTLQYWVNPSAHLFSDVSIWYYSLIVRWAMPQLRQLHAGFSLQSLRFNPRRLHMRLVVDKVALEHLHLQIVLVPLANHHSTTAPYSSIATPTCVIALSRQHIITSLVFEFGLHLWARTWLLTELDSRYLTMWRSFNDAPWNGEVI
jgi:hypothetical protein